MVVGTCTWAVRIVFAYNGDRGGGASIKIEVGHSHICRWLHLIRKQVVDISRRSQTVNNIILVKILQLMNRKNVNKVLSKLRLFKRQSFSQVEKNKIKYFCLSIEELRKDWRRGLKPLLQPLSYLLACAIFSIASSPFKNGATWLVISRAQLLSTALFFFSLCSGTFMILK